MKKLTVVAALAIAAASFTACGNQAPKEDLKSDIDSLSYAFGIDQGQGVKQYLQQMNIDTAYIDEFIKGLNDGATNMDDKKKAAYNAGIGVGMNMNMVIKKPNQQEHLRRRFYSVYLVEQLPCRFCSKRKGQQQEYDHRESSPN